MWWREREQEEPSLYNQILQIEARIAKLVAHQTRLRRLLMQDASETLVAEMIRVQDDVETHLRVMRRQREEWVERYEGDRLMRSLGRMRDVVQAESIDEEDWERVEQTLALEVEQLRRVLVLEQQRRREEGWS